MTPADYVAALLERDREIERLRAALRRLLGCPDLSWQEMDDVSREAIAFAREALKK